jgi:hypothetical protein
MERQRNHLLGGADADVWAQVGGGLCGWADGVVSGLTSGQIEIMYTLAGDANLDRGVNGSDFGIVGAHFGLGVSSWDEGDFDYNGVVNGSDESTVGNNFGQGSMIWPAGSYAVPPQYTATFTDAANTPLSDLSATIDWGDSSTPTAGAIVSDGNGAFHVLANHVYGQSGTYQVTTTITDSNSNSTTEVESTAVVSPAALTATPLDAYDIQLLWPALPVLGSGSILQISTDPNFQTNVTTENLSPGVTDFVASNLSPSTAYYFELLPAGAGMPVIGFTSAATDPSDGNGGTSGPTAPAITQAATYSQPTNTTLSLTMTAASGNDAIDYSWQLVSGPGGAQPEFTNSEQTTDVVLSAAGNYDFRCTATDDDTGLSVANDVSVDVNQVATSISVAPSSLEVWANQSVGVPSGTQLTAKELDQFGIPMLTQPATFSWTLENPALGSVSSDGVFTAEIVGAPDPVYGDVDPEAGATAADVSAGNLTATVPIDVMGDGGQVGVFAGDWGNLPNGTVVTDQFPGVTFGVPSGYTDTLFQGGLYVSPAGVLSIDFAYPVDDLYLYIQETGIENNGSGDIGTVTAYSGSTSLSEAPLLESTGDASTSVVIRTGRRLELRHTLWECHR